MRITSRARGRWTYGRRRHLVHGVAVLLSLVSFASPVAAQSADGQAPAAPAAPGVVAQVPVGRTPASGRPKPKVRFELDEHPTVILGPLQLALRASLRSESRRSDAPLDDGPGGLDLPRRRVGVDGALGDVVEFQIERELDRVTPWRDVYVNVRPVTQLQVQAGQFKLPFGLDENVGSVNLDFVNRSLLSRVVAPGRDRGVMVHGRVLRRIIRYEVGRFDHDGANAESKSGTRVSGGPTQVVRLSAQPFRHADSPAKEFQVGVAWAGSTLSEGLSSIKGETTMGRPFFASEYPVFGERRRIGFETRWRPGPFSVQAEYMRLTEERLGEGVEDTDLSPIRAIGWYASGTWVVTGDRKAAGLTETKHPIGRGIGAVELAVRVEDLAFDSAARGEEPSTSPRAEVIVGNRLRALTFGANWYLNRWVKLQLNVVRETVADPEQGPMPSKPTFWGRVVRLHFSL
jgi:phosphate-selective porin OprO/OprP